MIFQDNIIKEYLRNVYFISGTPCGGKTTITRALGEKYNIPVYVIDDQMAVHQLKGDKEHHPNMTKEFKDADEFFTRSVEEYRNCLIGNSREQLDFILLDLIKMSQDQRVLCDIHIVAKEAFKFTDSERIAFLIKEPKNLVDDYCNRPDHQPFSDFIHSATDFEKAKATCNETLYSLNIERYNFIKNSDFFWLERDNNRSVEETADLVAAHFGWNNQADVTIEKVDKGTPLADELLSFIENCSYEAKDHIAGLVRNWEFSDWETMFAAKADGKVIGMASALKEDYYPMPELFPWVSCIFVDEDYRGQRISGRLIDYANGYLKKQGFEKSYIPTCPGNVGLYEHYGYSFVKEITNYGGDNDLLYVKEI